MNETYNELNWIITTYGKNRLTEMLSNPEERLKITKLEYGINGEGTIIDRDEGLIASVGSVVIYEKGLDEDRPNTVYFKSIIDENVNGYDIRELALIETLSDGTEKVFAVGMGAPIVKPSMDLGYIITVDYTIFLESINLYKVYDRVILDPDNEFLKETDIENLHKIVLFAEGNLCEQISNNSRILGLNRAEQLSQLITESKKDISNNSIINFYVNLLNSLNNTNSEITGFWSFNYTDALSNLDNIKDFSYLSNNLSTKDSLNIYTQEYLGLLSTLNFENNTDNKQYFYLNKVNTVSTNNPTSIELGTLIDHTTVDDYVWSGGQWYSSLTGTARSNTYFNNNICKYYLKATTVTTSSTTISIVTIDEEPDIKYNGYSHTWTYSISSNEGIWTNEIGTKCDIEVFKSTVVNYTGIPNPGDTIILSTNNTPENGDIITLTGNQFDLLNKQQNNDCPFALITCLQHNKLDEDNVILAQSTYYNNIHNFEIIKTSNKSIKVILFSNKDKYITFETEPKVITDNLYSLIIIYNGDKTNPDIAIYIDGTRQKVTIENNNYNGMSNNLMKSTSYIINSDGNIDKTINAKIGLLTLIKNYNLTIVLSEMQIKSISLILNSLCGQKIYYKV